MFFYGLGGAEALGVDHHVEDAVDAAGVAHHGLATVGAGGLLLDGQAHLISHHHGSSPFNVWEAFTRQYLGVGEDMRRAAEDCLAAGVGHQADGVGGAEHVGGDAQHVPAHALGGVVLFQVGGEACAGGVAATGEHAALHLNGHPCGWDGVVEPPLALWVEPPLGHAVEAGGGFHQLDEVILLDVERFHIVSMLRID